MTIPNLPTDNLYKFTFLAGISLMLVCIVLLVSFHNKYLEKTEHIRMEIRELKTNIEIDSIAIESITKKQSKIDQGLKDIDTTIDIVKETEILRRKLLHDKNLRDYYSFLFDHEERLIPYYKDNLEVQVIIGKLDSLSRTERLKSNELTERLSILRDYLKHDLIYTIFLGIGLIAGMVIAMKGYNKWLNLVQKPIDEKLQLELLQLKTSLEKENELYLRSKPTTE